MKKRIIYIAMNKLPLIVIVAALALLAPAARAQAPAPGKAAIESAGLYFTEPYSYLEPAVPDGLGMSLDLDYARVKYRNGFVNTVVPASPPIRYKVRAPITDPDQQARVKELSGLKEGDEVTVVSALGKAYPARVLGFSYVGNSPSTILVMADLKIMVPDVDQTVYTAHGIAVKGRRDVPLGKIFSRAPLTAADPLYQTLADACAGESLAAGRVVEDMNIAPAFLTESGPECFVVSYWGRPNGEFEIEDVALGSCLLRQASGGYDQVKLPAPLKLLQVYDLDQDGQAELYGLTGDGAQVCYAYLVPRGETYTVLKQGMCAGY